MKRNMDAASPTPDPVEEAIFHAASDLREPEHRAAFLERVCGPDTILRARIELLLAADHRASQFMVEDPLNLDAKSAPKDLGIPLEQPTGGRIGRYKLLEKIGEGGMGVVYMAEQREPVVRKVALKIIKLGMDTRQVVARFEAERQALALMDHPNIARVLDGGVTEGGRPYFVMDLVQGVPITQFCDDRNLSTRARLDLFLEVCSAVQHAHQKGLIHRDLKPTNILVTLHGDKPVPKVIDFGVAKATQQRLTDKTLFTQFQHFIGTPAYMSPEQAGLSGLDIDTRSDIYGLGVLLYELLTGKTPFDASELLKASLDEMRRTILEKEPLRPSTRLNALKREELTTTAKRRQTESPKLIQQLRGDLDWIVMKCLEKDRARRYETANGLAMDLQRHLKNEPVVARPPSAMYRVEKAVRRHKLAFTAAGIVTLALVAALVVSSWSLAQEKQARIRAVAAEAKSRQVARFLEDMLQGSGPSMSLGRDATMLREILDKTRDRVGKDLKDQPEVQAELLSVISRTYRDLGEYDQAERAAREGLRLRRSCFGETNYWVAVSLRDVTRAIMGRGVGDTWSTFEKAVEGESLLREALAIWKQLGVTESKETAEATTLLAWALRTQGYTLLNPTKLTDAESASREALLMRRRLFGDNDPQTAHSLATLAVVLLDQAKLTDQGKLTEAEDKLREALAIQRNHPDGGVSEVYVYLGYLGGCPRESK